MKNPTPTLADLGRIMIETAGQAACARGYHINPDDPEEVGRQALLHGDINRDGTLN